MKHDEEKESEDDKISLKLNKILIERIRKYEIQDTSQLVNGPNDEDTNSYYLGGLINFDGGNNDTSSNYEIGNDIDIDKMTENDIYLEPYQYNDYNELDEDLEEMEENEKEIENISNNTSNKIKQEKNSEKNNIETDIINKENKTEAKNIRIILSENFNQYLDKIQKNYNKYSNNHFPKIITTTNNNSKKFDKN